MRVNLGAIAAAILAFAPAGALAHDFFLLPETFRASSAVQLEASVAGSFPTPEIVVGEDRIAETRASEGAALRILGPSSRSLRLSLEAGAPGAHLAAVRLLPRDVEYAEDRIPLIMEEYEVDEAARAAVAGLPAPRVLRASSERFAKSIVCFQSCEDRARAAQAAGYPLEFVADPANTGRFVLLLMGTPLPNYPVALAREHERAHLVTDATGGVVVGEDVSGPFMLFAAHMSAPADAGQRFRMLLTSLTAQLD